MQDSLSYIRNADLPNFWGWGSGGSHSVGESCARLRPDVTFTLPGYKCFKGSEGGPKEGGLKIGRREGSGVPTPSAGRVQALQHRHEPGQEVAGALLFLQICFTVYQFVCLKYCLYIYIYIYIYICICIYY